MSRNCSPTLVLNKSRLLPRNMQVWGPIFSRWRLSWVNVSYLCVAYKRRFILILITTNSNFHLPYLFFVTCFWWSILQGLVFLTTLSHHTHLLLPFTGRVNSPCLLAHMASMFIFIFQSRESFSTVVTFCIISFIVSFCRLNSLNDTTTFGKSFSESFLNFVMTLNPNSKWDSSDITPTWELWNDASNTEMLFNVTDAGAPDIRSVITSNALLERCEWVVFFLFFFFSFSLTILQYVVSGRVSQRSRLSDHFAKSSITCLIY